MTGRKVWALLPLVALVVAASASASRAVGELPVVIGATPHDDPTDRAGGGFLRVTFSPDADGRNDRVVVRVRAQRGERLVLKVRPDSHVQTVVVDARTATSALTTLTWDGLEADGKARAAGSYVLSVCRRATDRCATTRVLAHLRVLTIYAPRVRAVSVGEQFRCSSTRIASGRTRSTSHRRRTRAEPGWARRSWTRPAGSRSRSRRSRGASGSCA